MFWGGWLHRRTSRRGWYCSYLQSLNGHASYPSRESETACHFDCPMNLPRACHLEGFASGGQRVRRR